jgi:hypothetical protein
VPADAISYYLRSISSKLGLDRAREEEIARELAAHLEDSAREHQIRGLSMEEAQRQAVEAFGNPKTVSRKLKWVHGFGRYSKHPLIDALLGSLPFLLAFASMLVEAAVPRLGLVNYGVFVWIVVIGVSVYALKEAVPVWTVTWLGLANFLVLFILFGGIFGGARFVLGAGWPIAYLAAFIVASAFLILSSVLMAKKNVEQTLLFLLPLVILYATVGYEDAAPHHRFLMTAIAALFAFVFSFAYILTRNRRPVLFAALGLLFYSAMYIDIVRTSPSPLNTTGPALIGLWMVIYIVPLVLVSSPAYFYLKKNNVSTD